MSTTQTLIDRLKAELKSAGLTYAALARELGMAESSIKRMFAKGEMPLTRVDEICRALKIDFSDLARQVADAAPLRRELTPEQERAVVADRKLLLMAICCLSLWTYEQIVATYTFSDAECVKYLAQLDRIGIIELRPLNRYRLHVAKTFRWRPDGPVMRYFRDKVVADYFSGGFDGEGEMLMLVHGQIGRSLAALFNERLQRVAQDFAQQHLADQKLPPDQRRAYTLVIGMRSWLFAAFRDLKRHPDADDWLAHGLVRDAFRLLATLAAATAAALVCVYLRVPLPWMIGPLMLTAAAGMAGLPVRASTRLRHAGQWAIGVVLGLYFTPPVFAATLQLAPVLVAGAVWALLLGDAFARWLRWSHRGEAPLHPATAYFSAAIGGASEMAVLAERHGGAVDAVAAAHSLRVLLVVVIVPFALQLTGVHGVEPALTALGGFDAPGLLALVALTVAAALAVRRLGLPNPWVLGALGVTMALTASGTHLSSLPRWAASAGQLFIGVALGTRFTPAFLRRSPRWLAAVAGGTVAMIAASALFALALAALAGLPAAGVVLGNSPGGIAEMAITAAVLHLGVPTVTAFHLLRYVVVLTATGPIYRWRFARGAGGRAPG